MIIFRKCKTYEKSVYSTLSSFNFISLTVYPSSWSFNSRLLINKVALKSFWDFLIASISFASALMFSFSISVFRET